MEYTTERVRILTPEQAVDDVRSAVSPLGRAVREVSGPGGGGGAAFKPSNTLTTVPALLNSRRRWQQSAYTQDNVTTLPDGTQYVVMVDDSLHPVIAKRTVGSGKWETFDLRSVPGDPFGEQVDDSHCTYSLAVDGEGNVHVAGNMHSDPMRYARMTVPGDLTSFIAGTMTGTSENLVTYPMFFQVEGTLFLAYRNGHATSGDFHINRWSTATSKWVHLGKILDGITSNEGAYIHRAAVRGNKVGLFIMWRGSGDASTNTDFGYIESTDGCITWKDKEGVEYPAPITHAAAPVILPAPVGSGMINQGGADLDVSGEPHAAIQLYDDAGKTQLHHVYWAGSGWVNEQVTDWNVRVETIAQTTLLLTVARPSLICTDGGRTYIVARTTDEGLGGRPVMIDCTQGADKTPFPVLDMDLAGWEPAIDSRALRERGELNMFVMSIDQVANIKKGWTAQWGGVLSIDLGQIDALQSRRSHIGTIRKVAEYTVPTEEAKVGTTNDAPMTQFGIPYIDARQYGLGARMFARLSARFSFNSGTTAAKFYLRETPTAGSLPAADVCMLDLPVPSYGGIQTTPWEPLQQFPYEETDGKVRDTRLIPRGWANDAAGVKIGPWTVEIGVLET